MFNYLFGSTSNVKEDIKLLNFEEKKEKLVIPQYKFTKQKIKKNKFSYLNNEIYSKKYENLFNNTMLSDVKVKITNTSIVYNCHKFILSKCSGNYHK
jgi:hypothetical protein